MKANNFQSLSLDVKQMCFRRGGQEILCNVDLHLDPGEVGGLVGPSGAGKSTILRLIAGLEEPDTGTICVGQEEWSSPKRFLAPEKRKVGMVFQDFSLLPHLNVRENIAFGIYRWEKSEREKQTYKVAKLLGIDDLLDRGAFELSGGQAQRVALARVLATQPRLLLLDEPFSQLDPELRAELISSLRAVVRETGVTALLVTHHQEDAYDLCDRFGVLANNRLAQWGTPFELYHRPRSRFVADFIGEGAFINARWSDGILKCALGDFKGLDLGKDDKVFDLLVRPDDVCHVDGATHQAQILDKRFRGSTHLYTLALESGEYVYSLVQSHHDHKVGEEIGIKIDLEHVNVFEKEELSS